MAGNLTYSRFGKPGFPTSVLGLFPMNNTQDTGVTKLMLSTKLLDANDGAFDTIRRRDDESLHLICFGNDQISTAFRRKWLTKFGGTSTGAGFRRVCPAKAVGIAKHGLSRLLDLFRRDLSTATMTETRARHSDFLAALRRVFRAEPRTGNTINVETLLTKWFQSIKPVLLASGQEFRKKHQFQDLKEKGILTILGESGLKFGVRVNLASKLTKMLTSTLAKVYGTANVDFAGNGASDAVDARCGGDTIMVECGHSYIPLTQVCSLGLARASNTLLGRFIFPHYTTSTRFPSSFTGVRFV